MSAVFACRLFANRLVPQVSGIGANRSLYTKYAVDCASREYEKVEEGHRIGENHPGSGDPNIYVDPRRLLKDLTPDDYGKFYRVSHPVLRKLHYNKNLSNTLRDHPDTFGCVDLMVRQPLLDIINVLNHSNLRHPPLRFMIYGHFGTGKSITLAMTRLYAFQNDFLSINFGDCLNFGKSEYQHTVSEYKPGRVDTPVRAARFLQRFKDTNAHLWASKMQKMTTTKEYKWTKLDSMPVGTPLSKLIKFGIVAQRHSSDCLGALTRELCIASAKGDCKVMVFADMVNALFTTNRQKFPYGKKIPKDSLTDVQSLLRMMHGCNPGRHIMATIDSRVSSRMLYDAKRFSPRLRMDPPIYPASLLKDRSSTYYCEPYIPIETDVFSPREADQYLRHSADIGWLTDTKLHCKSTRDEMRFACGHNPFHMGRMVASK